MKKEKKDRNIHRNAFLLGVVLLLVCAVPVLSKSLENSGNDPFQPVVSRDESKLLTEAMNVALTNASAAIVQLKEEMDEDSSAALDFALGNLYFQEEQYDAAVEAYRAALGKMPHFRRARENLGRVYLLQQKPGETIALYQKLVEDGQASADILLLLGHALMMQDAAVSAENAYRQTLLLSIDNREAMFGLARSLVVQERYREAMVLLAEILQHEPFNQACWALRVNVLLALDKQEEALCCIEQARRLELAGAEMLATLGDLYINRNQPAEAVDAYRKAFDIKEPSVTRMFRAAEGMLMLQQTEYAGEMITRIEEKITAEDYDHRGEDRIKLLRLKSMLARLQDNTKQAEDICRQILREDPLDASTMLILGDLLRGQDKLEDALIQYEQAARVSGFEAAALVQQAQIEVERERYIRAVQLLERAQAFEEQPRVAQYLQQIRRMAE